MEEVFENSVPSCESNVVLRQAAPPVEKFYGFIEHPWRGKNEHFRVFIRSALYFGISGEQTEALLSSCQTFERDKLKLSLLDSDPRKIIEMYSNNPRFMLHIARVALLMGVVYYLGAEIPKNQEMDSLAWRYVEVGVAFGLTDACVLSGII